MVLLRSIRVRCAIHKCIVSSVGGFGSGYTHTHTHTPKLTCQLSVWSVCHTKKEEEVRVFFCFSFLSLSLRLSLSICLSFLPPRSSLLPPLSSAAVHPAPLAACMAPSQQINHSSPGGRALCSSARCCTLLCLRGNSALWATSTWPCFDTAVSGWVFGLCGEPHHSSSSSFSFFFLHELFFQTMTTETHRHKQDAGPLCHQLMITAVLPERLEQMLSGGSEQGAFQRSGKSNCEWDNGESVSCLLESYGGNLSLTEA